MPHSDPKYPVIKPDPTVDDCIKSMRVMDYVLLASVTGASWALGYLKGHPARSMTASTASVIGFTFASFIVLQDTSGRFMGAKENAREVKQYGMAPPEWQPLTIQQDRRFPRAIGPSTVPRPAINWQDYN
jgi:hypothetical protein